MFLKKDLRRLTKHTWCNRIKIMRKRREQKIKVSRSWMSHARGRSLGRK